MDVVAARFEMTLEQVLENVRAEIADVRVAVDGRPAGVDFDGVAVMVERRELFELARVRIIEARGHEKDQRPVTGTAGAVSGSISASSRSTLAIAIAAMPSARPRKPSFSLVVALTLTRPTGKPQTRRELVPHGVEMRRDLRRFGDERRVHVDDARVVRGEDVRDAREDFRGADAADGFVRVREMVADVPGGDGAEQRIGDGVDEHVGVRVAVETFGVWDLHAAEYERATFDQRVDIVTDAGENRGGHSQICGLEKQ